MSAVVIGFGLTLMAFGVLGTIILPDLFLRLHAATKCGVTGAATVLLGLALRAGEPGLVIRLILIAVLLFWTTPLVPHLVAVAYLDRSRDEDEEAAP